MQRPIIDIPLEPLDRLLEFIALVSLAALVLLPILYFEQLPEKIPSHFGPGGLPDGYSDKSIIWLLPFIGAIIYFALSWINKSPHTFNYPQKITEQNAERLYRTATQMMRNLKALIVGVFAYITFVTIHVALGNLSGLGKLFTPVFFAAFLGIVGYGLYQSLLKEEGV